MPPALIQHRPAWHWATSLALFALTPLTSHAHISLDGPPSRYTQSSNKTADQAKLKQGPCGASNDRRTTDPTLITTFKPGETITVTWRETVQHPGHYRVAFDSDGQDFTLPGATLPSGVTILADDIADKSGSNGLTYSQSVTLPNIECSNCTLQLIQVMVTTPPPYDAGDLYFNCADIVLSSGANAGAGGASGRAGAGPTNAGSSTQGGFSFVNGGGSARAGRGAAGDPLAVFGGTTARSSANAGAPTLVAFSGGQSGLGGRSAIGSAALGGQAVATAQGGTSSSLGSPQGGAVTYGGGVASGGSSSSAPVVSSPVFGGTSATTTGAGGNGSSTTPLGGASNRTTSSSIPPSDAPTTTAADSGCSCHVAHRGLDLSGVVVGLLGVLLLGRVLRRVSQT